MNSTGFDNEISLIDLCDESIKEIEEFVDKNKSIIQGTIYADITPFHFRPRHRVLLLNLPRRYREFKEEKNKSHEGALKRKKTVKSDNDLKTELLEKLKNYCKRKNYPKDFSEEHIVEFVKTGENVRCRVKCVFCDSSIVCNYISHWRASNYELHLFEHIKAQTQPRTRPQQTLQITTTISAGNPPFSIIPIDPELARILNN